MFCLLLLLSFHCEFITADDAMNTRGFKDSLNDLTVTVVDLKNTILHLTTTISNIQNSVIQLERRVDDHIEESSGLGSTCSKKSPEMYQFNSYGCLGQAIPLFCDGGKTIHVESARYSMYSNPCIDQCCIPNTGLDCSESVEESQPQDWLALIYLCENQTSCAYEYTGFLIDSCMAEYIADYMMIYYTCLPENLDEPVGFLVCHVDGNIDYEVNDVVRFDVLQSNFGNGFQNNTNIFICPRNGIYMFSVNVQSTAGRETAVRIRINSTRIVQAWSDSSSDTYGQASNVAIVHCNKHDRVYVDISRASTIHGDFCRTTFSGFLLYTY